MTALPLLSLILAIPLAGAALVGLLPGRWARSTALLLALGELALAVATITRLDPGFGGFQLLEKHPWIPSLGIHYQVGVDTLSALFLPVTALLFVAVILAGWPQGRQPMARLHFSMLLLLEGATLGVFMALDTMLFFLFWELTLAPIYFLTALWGVGPHRRQAATKYTLLMLAGGVPVLFGFLLAALHGSTPVFSLPDLLAQPLPRGLQTTVFLLLLLGFGVKTPLVPLHTWLPTVAMEGPAGVAALMTGLKLGAYGLLRFAIPLAPAAAQHHHWLLAALGVTGILYGGLAALAQTNLRRMLAYASISHVGLVVLGLASFNIHGIQGAVFQLLSFALVSGGLFCLVGFIHQRLGSTDVIHLGGLARSMPLASSLFLLFGLGSVGMPLTAGFPGEILLLLATAESHLGSFLAALAGGILGAAALLGFYRQGFLGPVRHGDLERGPDLLLHERLALGMLGGALLLGGLMPMWLLSFIQGAAQAWLMGLTR